jgi:WD40 repeat protein
MPKLKLEAAGKLSGHKGEVLCVHSPGGGRLASGGEDGSVRIWDINAGRATRALLLPAAGETGVTSVCMGVSGEHCNWLYAATGTDVCGFDLRQPGMLLREPARRFAGVARDEIGHITLHEASGMLAAADDAGDVHVLPVGDGATDPPVTLSGAHTSICSWVAFRPGEVSQLCSAGLDATCIRWDWRAAVQLGAAWPLHSAYSAASSGGGGQMCNPRHAHCVSFAPDGGTVAVALGDGSVEVRLAESGEPIAAVDAHRAATSQAHFCPQLLHTLGLPPVDPQQPGGALPLITAGDDRRLRLWAVEGVAGRGAAPGAAVELGEEELELVGGAAGAEEKGDEEGEEEEEEEGEEEDEEEESEEDPYGEPGFRSLAVAKLPCKPNGIAAAAELDGEAKAIICAATTGAAIELLCLRPSR